MIWILAIVCGYVVGSIPFGVLLGRLRGIDIRAHGSRNIGATNVGRVLGRPWGILCFGLDAAKGAAPVVGAGMVQDVLGRSATELGLVDSSAWMAVVAATVAGHMASCFLRFKGGKGVATALGALLAVWPILTLPALTAFATWGVVLGLFRMVSVASVAAAVSIPLWYLAVAMLSGSDDPSLDVMDRLVRATPPAIVVTGLAVAVVWRHRSNLARVRAGTEPKLGRPSMADAADERSS